MLQIHGDGLKIIHSFQTKKLQAYNTTPGNFVIIIPDEIKNPGI
jgi:hypothetical protein